MRPEPSHQAGPAGATDRPTPSDAELAEAAVHQPAEGPPPGVGVEPVASARKRELDSWRDTDGADTERLRTTVRGYRDLLDRLTGR